EANCCEIDDVSSCITDAKLPKTLWSSVALGLSEILMLMSSVAVSINRFPPLFL
ncbi:1295_t:CDS:2, partial [Dentiscutata erythropus]